MKNRFALLPLLTFAVAVCALCRAEAATPKQIALIAGPPSHGYGSHEHYAGCRILAETLNEAHLNVQATAYRGWPEDESVLDEADAIAIYCDGGRRHIALKHSEEIQKQIDRGVGFVCIHYAVEVPKGEPGKLFLNWLGGYFETDWSVNPHWTGNFKQFPDHPIASGVEPFSANDEWYFHMRFQQAMKGVTPILSDVPPDDTMRRPDGAHSGNPHVRKAIANKEPQHVAWAYDRPDGGRSFGFTGGHFHWNWGNPTFRRVAANALVWAANADVPADGVGAKPLAVAKLQSDQDEKVPGKFSVKETAKKFKLEPDDTISTETR